MVQSDPRAEYRQKLEQSFQELQALQKSMVTAKRGAVSTADAKDIGNMMASLREVLDHKQFGDIPIEELAWLSQTTAGQVQQAKLVITQPTLMQEMAGIGNAPIKMREEDMRALLQEGQKIVSTELPLAQKKKSNARLLHLAAVGMGMVASGGLAAYLTGGMSLLPQILITGAAATAGIAGGYIVANNQLQEAEAGLDKVEVKIADLASKIKKETESLNAQITEFVQQAEKNKEKLKSGNPACSNHAANVKKSPTISQLAAPENAVGSHAVVAQSADGSSIGNKR